MLPSMRSITPHFTFQDNRKKRLMHSKGLFAALALTIILMPLLLLVSPAPVHAASVTLNPTSGTVGTSVLISGEGFVGHLAIIHWDGQEVATDIPISETGGLTYKLDIPHTCKGNHIIEVTDDSHWSGSSASSTFTVLPGIKVFPRVGREGTRITITGSGFAANEEGIGITWDGNTTSSSPSTADMSGKWHASLNIPETTRGEHFIGAFGNSTKASEVAEALFIVSYWAKAEPVSGPVGTEIAIDGFGFRIGEDGLTITYDGKIIKCNIVAESDGTFSTTLNIPPSTQGYHTIGIYGSSFTPKGNVPDIDFEVTPQIKLQPVSGNKGTKVAVAGSGFAKNEAITISFDEMALAIAAVADDAGSFSTILEVPQSKGKEHTISATGSNNNSAQAGFITEKTPPSAPQLLSPEQGDKLEIFSSVGDVVIGTVKCLFRITDSLQSSKPVLATFDWTDVAESGDVSYVFQVANTDDFSSPILVKENLADSEYAVPKEDALTSGSYSWRIKAIDYVGNESPWSEVREFELIPMSTLVLILSLAIPVLFIAVVVALGILTWRAERSKL